MKSIDLVAQIDALLPQTQCTRCGYPSCREYAAAIAEGLAEINQCPPGGAAGISQLAQLLNKPIIPLNPLNGNEKAQQIALIDEEVCIGCTLCIKACPVDAIIGANKMLHTVIQDACSGCDLCLPACPVDCISMHNDTKPWTKERRNQAKARFDARYDRREQERKSREARLAEQALLLKKMVSSSSATTPIAEASKDDLIAQIMAKAKQQLK